MVEWLLRRKSFPGRTRPDLLSGQIQFLVRFWGYSVNSKPVWLVLAVGGLVFLCGPVILLAESFTRHMQDADDFLSKGNFESAIAEYQKALKRQPRSVWAKSRLGMAYVQWGDWLVKSGQTDRAIDAYQRAVAYEPDEPYWHEQLGKAWENKGDHGAAANEYRTAVQLLPLDDGLQNTYAQFIGESQRSGDRCGMKVRTVDRPGPAAPGRVSAPFPIQKPDPPYSDWARQAKLQGTVILWIVVDQEGKVACTTNVKPLGLDLDRKALETVRTWTFQPAMLDGSPVPVRIMVEVTFRLF